MANFPTLSQNPDISGWEEQVAFNPTIRSETDGGYVLTRARFTRLPRRWNLVYRVLPVADVNTLKTFEGTVKVGSDSFLWTNPQNSTQYTVRLLEPIRYSMHGSKNYWDVEMVLEEV